MPIDDSLPPSRRQSESDHYHLWSACPSSQAADDADDGYRYLKSKLISPPPRRSRHPRQPQLPRPPPPLETDTDFAISASTSHNSNTSRQDVRGNQVNASPTLFAVPTFTDHNASLTVESPAYGYNNHVSITTHRTRPRTSSQVFHSTSDLAAHHGIPQFLPPAPRTTPRIPSAHEDPISPHSLPEPESDFSDLCSNYLTMLSQTPLENAATGEPSLVSPVAAPIQDFEPETVHALMEVLAASPEFRNPSDLLSEYMTSPFDSPFDDFLTTPGLGSDLGADILTSPMMDFGSGDFRDLPLFSDVGLDATESPKTAAPALISRPNFDDLYTMRSPSTPALDPSSVYPSPSERPTVPLPPPSSRRRSTATGTRKNITPDALLPVDAPIQSRKYVTPSATSRKDVPAVFAKKRARSQAFGDEEDQLEDDIFMLPPNPTEAQLIEAKRRQNTIAARRSRKRKLEYQRELEESIERLKAEKEHWKARALACEALLKHHGLEAPNYDDDD
jgi:hypothetical protein